MTKLSKKLTLLILFVIQISFSQAFYETYDWASNPTYNVGDIESEPIAALKEKIVTEFYFEGEDFTEYYLEHQILYVNSEDAIERNNKIYLPYNSDSKLKVTKARVISKSGKVNTLDSSKILTAKDEETNRTYKYFALEGIEKGSIIEYYYVEQKSPSYQGRRVDLQSRFPKINVEFDLISPKNLVFKSKSYNGLQSIKLDETIEDKNHWKLRVPNLTGLEGEEFGAVAAERQFLVYALDKNIAARVNDITSYAKVSQNVYDFYNKELSKKESKALDNIIKTLRLDKLTDDESKIRAIEVYIKTNIYAANGGADKLSNLESILSDKVANDRGLIKLFMAIFKKLNISNNIVYTCSREYMKFDKDFEANNFLQEILIYFPKTKKYLSPDDNESRYGYPPPYLTDNYGLFIKEVKVGDFISAVGQIKFIKPIKAAQTIDKMILDVNFDIEDLTSTTINLNRSISGYYGASLHPFMDLIKPEDKKEIIEGFAKRLNENVEISNAGTKNAESNLFGIKPLEFILEFSSDAFVEKAGNKYLFKVGDLIGRQIEMYQEKKRVLPIEGEFQRSYIRTINIIIPEGYSIANLDDIIINNVFSQDGEEVLTFKSNYELNGNKLTIKADEDYKINHVDLEYYEDYRRIINSAADFNKITLVLVKD